MSAQPDEIPWEDFEVSTYTVKCKFCPVRPGGKRYLDKRNLARHAKDAAHIAHRAQHQSALPLGQAMHEEVYQLNKPEGDITMGSVDNLPEDDVGDGEIEILSSSGNHSD